MTPTEKILTALADRNCDPRRNGHGWASRCPAHDDRRPSLSISEGDDGRALIKCHAGCTVDAICKAVGMQVADLMPKANVPSKARKRGSKGEPRIVATYDYCDESRNIVYQVVRYEPKGFKQRSPTRDGDWNWKTKGIKPIPYRLPDLLAADPSQTVVIVEGEKDVNNLTEIGIVATTNHGGAGKWKADHAKYLKGRHVAIIPDADEPGKKHANQVALSLHGIAASTRIFWLPNSHDTSDWLQAGGTAQQLIELISATPEWTHEASDAVVPENGVELREQNDERKSQSTLLVELAAVAELWHTPDQDVAYATMPVANHREHWPIRGRNFKRWLSQQFFVQYGRAPGSQALQDAMTVLEGKAIFDGGEYPVFVRIAGDDERLYVDLANEAWQVVEVDAGGWRILDQPPIRFRRANAMLPLPIPAAGGSIEELRRFVNVDDNQWPLIKGWLVGSFRASGPYPVLLLEGEQGSAKSTNARTLRCIMDPNAALLRCEPRDPRDLMIAANNGWVIALDNLSSIPVWLSDALCRLSTGGGFSTRTLYENDEETIFNSMRPLILTGIEELANRSDLLDRSLKLSLPRIAEAKRRTEKEHWREFEEAHGCILGATLDAVSAAMRELPRTHITGLPRMADFALWATAAESGMGLRSGEFMAAYCGNRESANETALESSPLSKHIIRLSDEGGWEGEPSELYEQIESMASDAEKRSQAWPKSPSSLTGKLKRLAPNLRATGVDIEFGSKGRGSEKRRNTVIRARVDSLVPRVPSVPDPDKAQFCGDRGDASETSGGAAGTQHRGDSDPNCATLGTQRDGGDATSHSQSDNIASGDEWGVM
jgi:hypothetical protein